MKLAKYLKEQQNKLLDRWFEQLLAGYPPEAIRLYKNDPDPCTNPVGHILFRGMKEIFDDLVQEEEAHRPLRFLEEMIRMRAVQGFSASQGISFLVQLKAILRNEVKKMPLLLPDFVELESRIDEIILLSVDIFSRSRETLFEIRVNEAKSRVYALLKLGNLLEAGPEEESAGKEEAPHMVRGCPNEACEV